MDKHPCGVHPRADVRQLELDHLLRLSLPSYSLKKVEAFYFPERQTDVVGGDESTVVFERFLETGDESLLAQIEAYNKDDCDSTLMLHEWLVGLRPPDLPWAQPPPEQETSDEAQEAQTEREEVQAALRKRGHSLLADLLDFHRRDAKPAWWDYFRRLTMDEAELIGDADAIGGIACREHDQARVIDEAVGVLKAFGEAARRERLTDRIACQIHRARRGKQATPAEIVVHEETEAQQPGRAQTGVMRQHKTQRMNDVRGDLPQHLALEQRLADQTEFIVLKIAKAAVDELARPRRRAAGEIIHFTKKHGIAAARGVAGDTAAVNASADDCEVENLVQRLSPALAIFTYSDFAFVLD